MMSDDNKYRPFWSKYDLSYPTIRPEEGWVQIHGNQRGFLDREAHGHGYLTHC